MAILKYLLLISSLCLVVFSGSAHAAGSYQEYQVKAAFLYNFLSFVEWPASAHPEKQKEISICVLGEDPFGKSLDALEGREVGERTVAIKRLESPKEMRDCHSVFIGDSEEENLNQVVEYSRKYAVLTIADLDSFAEKGGIIQFTVKDKRIRFKINVTAAGQAGLKISSKLLRVGDIVGER